MTQVTDTAKIPDLSCILTLDTGSILLLVLTYLSSNMATREAWYKGQMLYVSPASVLDRLVLLCQ